VRDASSVRELWRVAHDDRRQANATWPSLASSATV